MSGAKRTSTGPSQSAAMPSPFPPIADYAFLSNCHTGALIAPDGAIDWLCVPPYRRWFRSPLPHRRDRRRPVRRGRHVHHLFLLAGVRPLAIVGEEQRARDLMDRLLRIASPLGLYAEEFDTGTGRHLGNFPQAFSHLALIEAAARIIVSEMLEEHQ